MRPFRCSFRIPRALEPPHSFAPQRTIRPNHVRGRKLHASPRRRVDLPSGKKPEKPDPLEEWRNPPPSKWPNRIRLLFVPFIGALVYSMVRRDQFLHFVYHINHITVDGRHNQKRNALHRRKGRPAQARKWRLGEITHAPTNGAIHKATPKGDCG
jgi:hypothetical protein